MVVLGRPLVFDSRVRPCSSGPTQMYRKRILTRLDRIRVCCSCSKPYSTSSISEKSYLVTTPIFYPTASPHIGHLYTLVLADILKRWQILRGNQAILNTGTDEHGKKVWQAAEKLGMPVKEFCGEKSEMFKLLAHRIDAQYDHFVRTSEPEHRFAVQHFWMMLNQRGYIYQSKYEGWYSVSDEAFYPENAVHRTLDPATGRKFMASKDTGKEVDWVSEVNYHFRLSAFRDRLLEHYRSNPDFIVPASRMSEIYKQIVAGLDDLSISRPAERIKWGIPVPNDETQVIYVWLDALINYLTKANYPFQIPGEQEAGGWPADVQVIGKDISRFHCIYWPAFLMALDLPLPRQILTHGHWTLGGEKMAKSTGNVVNPFFAVDRFGVDPLRYYMAYDGGIRDDADYENSSVTARYKKGLSGGLGNLASRVLHHKGWSVRRSVEAFSAEKEQQSEYLGKLDATNQLRQVLAALPNQVTQRFESLDSGAALRTIMDAVFEVHPPAPVLGEQH